MFAFVVVMRRPLGDADRAVCVAAEGHAIPVRIMAPNEIADGRRLAATLDLPPACVFVATDDRVLAQRLRADGCDVAALAPGEPLAAAVPALEEAYCRATLRLRGLIARLFSRPH
jgi:hypothetical protein